MSVSTSYNNLNSSNGYYSLPQAGSTSNTGASQSVQPASNLSDYMDAYTLDLSPEAKSYIDATNLASSVSSFDLNSFQKEKLDEILQKFKDQPYTQDTFNQLQAELQKAGLSPDQLAAQQQAKDFSTTQMLLEALGGKIVNPGSQDDSSKYDSAKKSYMDKIGEAFQKIASVGSAS